MARTRPLRINRTAGQRQQLLSARRVAEGRKRAAERAESNILEGAATANTVDMTRTVMAAAGVNFDLFG